MLMARILKQEKKKLKQLKAIIKNTHTFIAWNGCTKTWFNLISKK